MKVAELNGFAAAARELGVTRTIATRYVSELEDELGAQLLVRTTRKVSTTVAGRLYLERMQTLLADLDRADELINQQHATLSGELCLSAPVSFGQRFLPRVLAGFRESYPEVLLKIHLTDRFIDIIEEGFDMALRISGRRKKSRPSGARSCPSAARSSPAPVTLRRLRRLSSPKILADTPFLDTATSPADKAGN